MTERPAADYAIGTPASGRYWASTRRLLERQGAALLVHDDGEQRVVDLEPILVVDESQSLEFLHEEIDPRSRRATSSASVSCEIFGTTLTGLFCVPYRASSRASGPAVSHWS